MIQNLSRELFAVADENGGSCKTAWYCLAMKFGTMPPSCPPAVLSRRSLAADVVPIIQSLARLKSTTKEGSEIIQDNCQDTSSVASHPTANGGGAV